LPTPPPITPIPPAREPNWLSVAFPKPGQSISLDYYNDRSHWRVGVVVVANTPASVCFDVWASGLIERGDYWNADDVVSRTEAIVDGINREVIDSTVADGKVAHGITLPGGPTPQASVGGPYGWCVSAPLAAGLHKAEVRFNKSSGEVISFAWTFTLMEGDTPTPTPLPTPSHVDRTGALPDYLRLAYPAPGTSVTPKQAMEDWKDFLNTTIQSEYYPDNPNSTPVCVALKMPDIEESGTLPQRDNERIFLQVDGKVFSWYPVNWFPYYDSSTRAQCIEFDDRKPGEHVAALYVDFFDAEILVYSWSFSLQNP
jgi:hypothetical protein